MQVLVQNIFSDTYLNNNSRQSFRKLPNYSTNTCSVQAPFSTSFPRPLSPPLSLPKKSGQAERKEWYFISFTIYLSTTSTFVISSTKFNLYDFLQTTMNSKGCVWHPPPRGELEGAASLHDIPKHIVTLI